MAKTKKGSTRNIKKETFYVCSAVCLQLSSSSYPFHESVRRVNSLLIENIHGQFSSSTFIHMTRKCTKKIHENVNFWSRLQQLRSMLFFIMIPFAHFLMGGAFVTMKKE